MKNLHKTPPSMQLLSESGVNLELSKTPEIMNRESDVGAIG